MASVLLNPMVHFDLCNTWKLVAMVPLLLRTIFTWMPACLNLCCLLCWLLGLNIHLWVLLFLTSWCCRAQVLGSGFSCFPVYICSLGNLTSSQAFCTINKLRLWRPANLTFHSHVNSFLSIISSQMCDGGLQIISNSEHRSALCSPFLVWTEAPSFQLFQQKSGNHVWLLTPKPSINPVDSSVQKVLRI